MEGEIIDKDTIRLLVRTFRKLERHLPLTEELKITGLEQHPRLLLKWSARQRKGSRSGWELRAKVRKLSAPFLDKIRD